MGAIAEAIVAYAQPLIDKTNGSIEGMERALAVSQMCFTLAQLPEQSREQMFGEMRTSLEMSEAEFDDFRLGVIDPMIQRHHQMFPQMHSSRSTNSTRGVASLYERRGAVTPAETPPAPSRYEPCPCNSGRKYKFCCGKKSF